jgi:hypothetical protein
MAPDPGIRALHQVAQRSSNLDRSIAPPPARAGFTALAFSPSGTR